MLRDPPDDRVWTLLVDGLDAVLDGAGPALPASGCLARLLARARHDRLPVAGWHALIAWLSTGCVDAVRRWPPGPVRYASATRREPPAGIMCADPVALIPDGDRLIGRAQRAVPLTQAELETLATLLAAGLDGSGALFSAYAGQWFLEFEQPPATRWWEPDQIDGRDVLPFMPTGSTAASLRRVMTEAQMILHEHPVNEARAERGQVAVNGLWPWGWSTGTLPAVSWRAPALHGDDGYARALLALSGQTVADADASLADGSALVVLRLPAGAAGLQDLQERWCEPLLGAMRRGRIDRLRLATPAGRCCELRRVDLLRFWRRWRP